MDYSQFSTDDLRALQTGDLSKVSTAALKLMQGPSMADSIKPEKSLTSKIIDNTGGRFNNALMAALDGASGIGSTLLAPTDWLQDKISGRGAVSRNDQRRADIQAALDSMGADKSAIEYGATKLGTEIAGTAGLGGMFGQAAKAVGASAPVVNALTSAGFTTGNKAAGFVPKAADLALRSVAGGAVGGATAGLVDPSTAGAGAVLGGALPGAVKLSGMAGNGISNAMDWAANKWMRSALKPTIAQIRDGSAETAVKTLLDRGINPTKGGVEKLKTLIDDLNSQIGVAISNSDATVSKQKVVDSLSDLRSKFASQVSPSADLNAIQGVADDFAAHPGLLGDAIPVQQAQELKQGTYRVLAKKYGQLGSAETEAQKGLARGLKDEIAQAVPGVGALNAEESSLISTLGVAERRALMDMNKNPMGLAALSHNPTSWAMFMADKSALFKSIAARIANQAAAKTSSAGGLLNAGAQNPLLRTGGLLAIESSP